MDDLDDAEPLTARGVPQRLGCLGWFVVVSFGVVMFLGLGLVGDTLWERYRPITDSDIRMACTQIVTDGATDWHTSTRTYVEGVCDERLKDPALREQIRAYLEERRR